MEGQKTNGQNNDHPVPGQLYCLIGGTNERSIANGNTWAESILETHDYKVGDILHHSWGYDQTNATFYQVVKISEHSAWIRQIESIEKDDGGFMTGHATPVKNAFKGETLRKHPYSWTGSGKKEYYVKINSYSAGASKWNGTPARVSHYA